MPCCTMQHYRQHRRCSLGFMSGYTSNSLCADTSCMHAVCVSCRVGFNSVYHVTDLPGFVSGEHLVFFDPHCKYLPAISAANPGKKINFVAHPVSTKLADQVAPFHFFGCDTQQPFQGTLFRFPLRTQQQADASTISKQVGTGGRGGKHTSVLSPTCCGGWLQLNVEIRWLKHLHATVACCCF